MYFFLAYNIQSSSTTTNNTCIGKLFNKLLIFLLFILAPNGNGVLRLYHNGVTSSSYYYGIVQIWYNGQWGNICDDDDYDQYEADVICHQLGYTGASSYYRAEIVKLVG